ncbi:MAG: hypothetical protein GXO40_04195 [Epsilonproteobacteria bacterium]|nr:hypothetical protein [Campylobacterota bacterium]
MKKLALIGIAAFFVGCTQNQYFVLPQPIQKVTVNNPKIIKKPTTQTKQNKKTANIKLKVPKKINIVVKVPNTTNACANCNSYYGNCCNQDAAPVVSPYIDNF